MSTDAHVRIFTVSFQTEMEEDDDASAAGEEKSEEILVGSNEEEDEEVEARSGKIIKAIDKNVVHRIFFGQVS